VHPLGAVQPVDGGDARVIERREHLRLALEAGDAIRILGEQIGQDLDGHVAPERRVGGAPHHPHPALADLLDQPVRTEDAAGRELHYVPGVSAG
jgi:hypothetical protein